MKTNKLIIYIYISKNLSKKNDDRVKTKSALFLTSKKTSKRIREIALILDSYSIYIHVFDTREMELMVNSYRISILSQFFSITVLFSMFIFFFVYIMLYMYYFSIIVIFKFVHSFLIHILIFFFRFIIV